jgi:flavodoxin I
MTKIGIFFGTESGTTRLIAKKIAKSLARRLGENAVAKPLNVNRIEPEDLLSYSALILGTPTYGEGALPGVENDTKEPSWLEFLPRLRGQDFTGIRVAVYGLGDQETYAKHFVDGMMALHAHFAGLGAEMVGDWSTEGYEFKRSKAVRGGRFVGLALDQHLQHLLTDQRIATWLDQIVPQLLGVAETDFARVAAAG